MKYLIIGQEQGEIVAFIQEVPGIYENDFDRSEEPNVKVNNLEELKTALSNDLPDDIFNLEKIYEIHGSIKEIEG